MKAKHLFAAIALAVAAALPTSCRAGSLSADITTDRACYKPGATVTLTATGTIPSTAFIRYRHGATVVAQQHYADVATNNQWTWQSPETDGQGYLVDIYTTHGTEETILATCAIDVSSDWKLFPRYGFVADFEEYGNPSAKEARIKDEMAWLNRCHINGVQFQDWQWKHHHPVKFDSDGQLTKWYQDISNRWVGVTYIKQYIAAQHAYGMKSIFYDLCFGAWKDAEADGVKPAWGLFVKNSDGSYSQDYHGLPSSWQSNIYLQNPANSDWQHYFADRVDEVYRHFDFDGYQIDQLGNRSYRSSDGKAYDAQHQVVDLPKGYASFIRAMKTRQPDKRLVMNAVSGYGGSEIAGTGDVDFCYNEVWGGSNGYGGTSEDQFANLYEIIRANDEASNNKLPTVFAAYMNYNKADNGGSGDKMMNTPGVLLTDAVMFAIGGAHLELGDHILSREYFPAAPLAMTAELKTALVHYYDFLTAYENLLRGTTSESVFQPVLSGNSRLNVWPPRANSITTFAKKVGTSTVLHLLNFLNTSDLSWRDVNGTRPAPTLTSNISVTLKVDQNVSRVWVATPDSLGGAPVDVPFTQQGNQLSFTVPSLRYWTMVVIETGSTTVNKLHAAVSVDSQCYSLNGMPVAHPIGYGGDDDGTHPVGAKAHSVWDMGE